MTASLEQDKGAGWRIENTYATLPDTLFVPTKPMCFRAPRVVLINRRLAEELGLDLDALHPEAAAFVFAGQALLPPATRK